MNWFTADWHLSHKNIITYSNRPFSSVGEMNKTIYDNFFSKVKNKDTVYFLGDLSFYNMDFHDFFFLMKEKNITINFIIGNHDYRNKKIIESYTKPHDYLNININGQNISLCHYAMRTWNKSCHGAWQFYGHSHGTLPPIGKQWDVGIDNNNFFPVSFNEIKKIMDNIPNNFDMVNK